VSIQHPSTFGYTARGRIGLRAILSAFTAIALIAIMLVGGVSLWGRGQAEKAALQTFVAKDVTADILPPPMYLIEMRLVLSQVIEGTLTPERSRSEFNRLKGEYEERVKYWLANPPFGLEAQLLGAQHTAAHAFIAAAAKLLDAAAQGDPTALRGELAAVHEQYLKHRIGVDATVKSSTAFADASIKQFDAGGVTQFRLQALVIVAAALLLTIFGVWIRRSIWTAVGGEPHEAAAIARAVAAGNLFARAQLAAGDRDSIMAALNQMSQSLAGIVAQVHASSERIASGSGQIESGNSDLSRRTEEQASALENTAASMTELTDVVTQNAEKVTEAGRLAQAAAEVAERGGQVVGQMGATMKEIDASSQQIEGIINLIDSIAFQTNILALNAAVEAARAGDQGRGFAVVASEVRNLAGRSAQAAREIKALIGASTQRVAQGMALADRAVATMNEVVQSIRHVSEMTGSVSIANARQNHGIPQIGEAIGHIDLATQQNSAMVEQCAAAAASLSDEARQLVAAVTVFKLGRGEVRRLAND